MDEHLQGRLEAAIKAVRPADAERIAQATAHWDAVAKPLHGLGQLENVIARMAGIAPLRRDYKKCVAAFCADNGVVAQGVTQTGSEVTAIVAGNMLAGELAGQGYTMLAAGEMGIGNTTTSSAVAAALLGRPAVEMTGRGAGLSNHGLEKKISVIDHAIALHRPDPGDPVDVLAKVGGYDIAAMASFYLGCALNRTPAIMDGFISTVAALAAVRLCPAVRDALTASHLSAEPGAEAVMAELGLTPLLKLGMALGEGTGAVSAMPLIDMALRVYFDMPSFDNIGIDAYQPQ